MTLVEKIKSVKPNITEEDFRYNVIVQNDGRGDYIKEWNHPTETQPTEEELS